MRRKVPWPLRQDRKHRGTCNHFLQRMSMVYLLIRVVKLTCNWTHEIRASSGLCDHSLDWESDKRRRIAMRKIHTVVNWLLGSSDFSIQLVIASLQELKAQARSINNQGITHVVNSGDSERETLRNSEKVSRCLTSKQAVRSPTWHRIATYNSCDCCW